MSDVYYSTLTRNQVSVIFAAVNQELMTVPKSMIDYLYALARQGGGFARETHEEDFRQRILKGVDLVIHEEYSLAQGEIVGAFKILCASRKSKALDKVRVDLAKMGKASRSGAPDEENT